MRLKILPLFAVFFGLLFAAYFADAQSNSPRCCFDSVFLLKGDRQVLLGEDYFGGGGDHGIVGVVIVPDEVDASIVTAAWSYAVQFGADGLTLINYERAVEIMQERHPTWIIALTKGYTINFDESAYLGDTQDATLTPMPESTENP